MPHEALSSFEGNDLSCIRGERLVFAGLDFSLGAGDVLVLVGANGSGKSSLLRIMAGLLPPAAGRLQWNDLDLAQDPAGHRERVQFVGHQDGIKPALTVSENLRFWTRLRASGAGDNGQGIEEALDAVGLGAKASLPAQYLSAGQRRRLALARLVGSSAPLWLLDEPKTALDGDGAARVEALLARHREKGGLAVIALHGDARPPRSITLDLNAFVAKAVP
jgi:heme exporter protein A